MEVKTNFITPKIQYLSPKKIDLPRYFPRTDMDENEILSLATNIRKNGLLCPLLVRRNIDHPKRYLLVSGFRRFYALQLLKAEAVPVLLCSLTEAEAELAVLSEDQTGKPLSIFEQAVALRRLLGEGRMTKLELADAFGITQTALEEKLSVLELSKQQQRVILNHSFSEEFVAIFLKTKADQREKILNHIIVNRLSNEQSIAYIKELLTPKKEPIKTASLSNDVIIMNSIGRLAEQLRSGGIEAQTKKQSFEDHTEYTLSIEKKLKQLSLL